MSQSEKNHPYEGLTGEAAREVARQRHGKPFHAEERQARQAPKSAFLRRLERSQRAGTEAARNVVPMQRKGGRSC